MRWLAMMMGSTNFLTPWVWAFALSAAACGTSSHPADDGNGGATGTAGKAAGSGGATGTAGNAAGSGGATGAAGKATGSGGATGAAGKATGSGGATGTAGNAAGQSGSAGAAANGGDDAGVALCAPCIDNSISWGSIGGFVAFTERSTLDACNLYHHTRSPVRSASPMLACDRSVPCMGSGLHGVSDVLQAIEHTDVQAALAKGTVLFGSDPRPVDGTVFEIVARDGTSIVVGSPCTTSAGCTAIPAGVSALADLLHAIDDEQIQLDPCRTMFQP